MSNDAKQAAEAIRMGACPRLVSWCTTFPEPGRPLCRSCHEYNVWRVSKFYFQQRQAKKVQR